MTKAKDPSGAWSEPLLIKAARGWEDPCPLWDDDGNAYLVSALVGSRMGMKDVLIVSRMSSDGTKLLDDGTIVFDGGEKNRTIEGPKFYKRNDYYYIFALAGGVESGWQLVLRAKNVYGPYEWRIVSAQGSTQINGQHQGAWVETQTGESWFIHFQDKGAFGRVVHLEPMRWVKDFPIIGIDKDNKGVGEPVSSYRKPNVNRTWSVVTPPDSDEFNENSIGLQWQWQENPQTNWAFPAGSLGFLRLLNTPLPDDFQNFWDVPNLVLQKFRAPEFTATTKVKISSRIETAKNGWSKTGLIVMGADYAYLSLTKRPEGVFISQTVCKNADRHAPEKERAPIPVRGETFYLRVRFSPNAACDFSFSVDGVNFTPVGETFTAKAGKRVGATIGVFAVRNNKARDYGYADYDWFRIEK